MSEGAFRILFYFFLSGLVGMALAVAFVFVFACVKGRPRKKRAVTGTFPAERLALLAQVARAYAGTVVNDPVHYRFPFFRASVEGRPYAVALAPGDGETRDPAAPYLVRFEAPIAGQRFVEAWPDGSPYPPLRMSSAAPDVDIGDPAFDAAHVVRTDDPAHARAILSDPLRETLARMRGIGNGGRVRFDLYPYKMQLQKEEMLAGYGELFEFTKHALAALAEVNDGLQMQAGVQFYDDAPRAPEKPSCPVCGAAISGARASCVRCHTPHHVDCWKYFGMCSMFACGEQRYSV